MILVNNFWITIFLTTCLTKGSSTIQTRESLRQLAPAFWLYAYKNVALLDFSDQLFLSLSQAHWMQTDAKQK